MKQLFLLLLIITSLTSCQKIKNSSAIDTTSDSKKSQIIESPTPQNNPSEEQINTGDYSYIFMDGDNCINSSRDLYGTGDILRAIIENTQLRDVLQKEYALSLYTPDYIKALQDNIQIGVPKLIVRYACNIDTNIDIIAGVDYLKVISEYNSLDEKSKNNIGGPRAGSSDIVLIRNNSQIIPVDSSVKIYNNTVTGGDVSHCKATKKYESVIWTCYLGLSRTESKESYQEYTIDIANGKVLSTRTYSEDI